MIRRTLHVLAVLVAAGALLFAAAPANAAPAAGCPNPFWGIFCPTPYLSTGFGPVAQATQISAAGADARIGKYSPLTGEFAPSTEWMNMVKNGWVEIDKAKATDGVVAPVKGYATVETAFGEAAWVTQYFFTHGRWGIYNLVTATFYPQGDWFPVS
jgi:hypothetical protein